MNLSEFLLARIGEDEAVARDATPGPWWNESGTVHAPLPFGRHDGKPGPACHPLNAQGSNGRDPDADAEHASRHDPARVLAECEAKRQIVELHKSWPVLVEGPPEMTRGDSLSDMTFRLTRQIAWLTQEEYRNRFGDEPPTTPMLRALALPYADHPDYREEWRP